MRCMIIALLVCLPASAAEFVVHGDQPLMESFVGFGTHANGWAYCSPNWGSITTAENVGDLERKFIDLAPQHVRIFVEVQKRSPQQSDPNVNESVARTVALAKRAGATVNLTLWHGPYKSLGDSAQVMVDMLVDYIRLRGLDNIKYVTLQNEPNEYNVNMRRYNGLYQRFDARLRAAGLRDQIKIIGGDLTSV